MVQQKKSDGNQSTGFCLFRVIFPNPKIRQYLILIPHVQAECEQIGPDTFPGKVAALFGIDAFHMIKSFCKPRIKVGTEWVTKGQTCEQATNA